MQTACTTALEKNWEVENKLPGIQILRKQEIFQAKHFKFYSIKQETIDSLAAKLPAAKKKAKSGLTS